MSNLFLDKSIPEILKDVEAGILNFTDLSEAVESAIAAEEEGILAWVRYDIDKLKKMSREKEEQALETKTLRPLEGIPFGVKDIFNTEQFPTQMGSKLWENFTPGNNARVVDSLVKDGALIVGKTVTAEFAVHSLNETMNPHDRTKTPGTSSSGSAAAVSAGMVPFALASQTAGSIIRPGSFCGVWGMKPSFGLVPRTGVLKTTDSLDSLGFISSHVENLEPVLNSIRVKGPNYPYVYKNIDAPGLGLNLKREKWKVGFIKTHTWSSSLPYVQNSLEAFAKKLSSNKDFDVEEVMWPEELFSSHEIHSDIYNKSLSYYFQKEMTEDSQVTLKMKELIEAGNKIRPEGFRQALYSQENFASVLDDLLSNYDFVFTNSTGSSAPQRSEQELPDPSLIWTLGHVPAITAPVFRCPEGLPFGVQFVSRRWNDYLLIQGVRELATRELIPKKSAKILPLS